MQAMHSSSWLGAISFIALVAGQGDKYTDENRPYKFGFNIEGHQHRKEEKDETGIIKGEYGFITADGYYRVTVYATDENGDFKIISMKNYYVGFPPGDPTTTPAPSPLRQKSYQVGLKGQQKFSPISDKPSQPSTSRTTMSATSVSTEGTTLPTSPGKGGACSSCFLPPTTRRTDSGIRPFITPAPVKSNSALFSSVPPSRNANLPGLGVSTASPLLPSRNIDPPSYKATGKPPNLNNPQLESGGKTGTPNAYLKTQSEYSLPATPLNVSGAELGNLGPQFQPNQPLKPISENKKIRPGEAAIRDKTDTIYSEKINGGFVKNRGSGQEKDGLPPGVTTKDIMDLLYRFNYTVGFHGHHEDGYRNGDKAGDYFINSRDGTSRRVEYIANEFGYQPNITLVNLQENDENRPKEDTEKNYGLKGYEFKWFYRK